LQKIVAVNGSPRVRGCTAALVDEVLKSAGERGAAVKSYNASTLNIKGCQSCYACRAHGKCVLQDDMQELYEEIATATSIIFATPVYMWQMTGQLKLVVDRLYPFLKPDYSSYLTPGKKVLLAVTQARPDPAMFHHYFEHMGKNLVFLGFGEYKILIAGQTHKPEDLLSQTAVVTEARQLGGWLAE
jgi:multimeric flavodoxin WrbA